AAPDRAEDRDAREEPAFRDNQPRWSARWPRLLSVVAFAEHDEQVAACRRIGVWRKMAGRDAWPEFERENIECREGCGEEHVRRREEAGPVEVLETQQNVGSAHGNDVEEDLFFRER